MMRVREGALQPRNIWRFFPWFIAAAMGVVVAVNFGMAYTALHTFPGTAGGDGFDLSNHYNVILDRMAKQAALGWELRAEVTAEGHPVIVLWDRSGTALAGAGVQMTAERPVGDKLTTQVRFSETSPGRYVGVETLSEKGQWELRISAAAGGQGISATRRIVVR
ncbi:MAG: FixH family protein [Acetobacteraceae bacterium]|jgi:nitrogen fixation protein FixH